MVWIDDVVNYIFVCLMVLLMIFVSGWFFLFRFVGKYGSWYVSLNFGYFEVVLVGILNCCFGGFYYYFGEEVWKFFIGNNEWVLIIEDMKKVVCVNW